MKKSTTKSAASPAPATKPTKPSAKGKMAAAAAPKAVVPVAPPPAKPAAAAPASVPPAAAATPAVKPIKGRKVTTTITAQIDVGFGNILHIRGVGPGLSWDKGIAMECLADNQWQIVLPESSRPIIFKFLVNDLSWSVGDDYTVEPGTSITLAPQF